LFTDVVEVAWYILLVFLIIEVSIFIANKILVTLDSIPNPYLPEEE